ncbi:crossover junction endodeoxyribonuclease RuvC [Calycomorphotria hydatis]|uniref:Crossover junction endodeoxyribonuclease RuvC n=1 Tax=Calycomorphotria hydatis TaxID=2528027 RepID=A0A517T4S3_9PLAN|nr:crossover junction endodeoxyribonuclease RuvC [Calycomorphotria hydatis]QDT63377.1 Crossover junction endodeoxyribonuclease RuvC [Calycomorphotria hydatis]
MSQQAEYVLGIDPSLSCTGYAVLERNGQGATLREGGVIRTKQSDSLVDRVVEIGRGVRELVEQYQPTHAAIEQVFSHAKFPKTAVLMGHVRGAILMAIGDADIPIMHFTPTEIKKLLTGHGRATKEQMQAAIQMELKLSKQLEPHDVADAAAIAIAAYHTLRISRAS